MLKQVARLDGPDIFHQQRGGIRGEPVGRLGVDNRHPQKPLFVAQERRRRNPVNQFGVSNY